MSNDSDADSPKSTPLNIIPQPVAVVPADGVWQAGKLISIVAADDAALPAAGFLARYLLEITDIEPDVSVGFGESGDIRIVLDRDRIEHGSEGYTLVVEPKELRICAAAPEGLFYGVQTLRQLLVSAEKETARDETGSIIIPAMTITDRPRFPWRGFHLDVSRHFFTTEEVKDFIDVMAAHKLNVFHWHLVDDQGWRIAIRKYPELTNVGAWRNDIGFGLDPGSSRNYREDGRYGGFYTQEDVRDIVAYAAERHVTILPEIELPGHSCAALKAHPELHCTGDVPGPESAGIFNGVYCAGKDETFAFLEAVLLEVLDLFPGEFIHIGGDEVPKDNWKACPLCQARMREQNLKDENELQSYFVRRIEKFLNAKGRRLIGWDEILEGGLAANAAVMSWRGMDGGISAANAGHDVVMTPTSHCYFDYFQEDQAQPAAIGGHLTLETVYGFDPVPAELPLEKTGHILGGGANLWTEFIPNYGHLQYMAWPRGCAMAEVLWTPKSRLEYAGFLERLMQHTVLLRNMGVLYARWMRDGRWAGPRP